MDRDVQIGAAYSYRLSDVDTRYVVTEKDMITITLEEMPAMTEFLPAFPNPFNPSTKIQYVLAEDATVTLSVVDMLGRTIKTIILGAHQSAGSYSIHWNGNDNSGQMAASGRYLLVLNAGNVNKTQKVMMVR